MSIARRKKLATLKDSEHPFAKYVRILGKGKTGSRSLSYDEAYDAMRMVMAGEVEDIQLGAFLMLLRVKEESQQELAGFVQAVRNDINAPTDILVDLDWSSYAGKKRQLPWYLLSAFLLADQGVRVFMHGASGHTIGRLYTESVLQQLGIDVAQDWQQVATQLDSRQFSFMPLEFLSPELKRIIDFRNYLGLRSPVHTLSRLLNPLASSHSIQSIFHPAYGDSHQQAAIMLGQLNAAVFKGEGGEIERKPEASCTVKRVIAGQPGETEWPKMISGRQIIPEELQVSHLADVWRGSSNDPYADLAVTGTTAIAIQLLHDVSNEQALQQASDWWQSRDRHGRWFS